MLNQLSLNELNPNLPKGSSFPLSLRPFLEAFREATGSSRSAKTISRWAHLGMPHRIHPITGERLYVLIEVLDWLGGIPIILDRPKRRATHTR